MLPLLLMAAALMPDCCLCGHQWAYHHPSFFTGGRRCGKRTGWRRRECPCQNYETHFREAAA